jgi:hypothetical protein
MGGRRAGAIAFGESVRVKMTVTQKAAYEVIADRRGMTLSAWVRYVLASEALKEETRTPRKPGGVG